MYMVRLSKNPNFGPKTSCFGPKFLFLVVQKFSKSGLADRAHRVCHFEVSYVPLAQIIWSGSPKELNGTTCASPPGCMAIL